MDHLQLKSLTKISEGLPVFPVHLRVSQKRKKKKEKEKEKEKRNRKLLGEAKAACVFHCLRSTSQNIIIHPESSTPQEEEKGISMEQPEFLDL